VPAGCPSLPLPVSAAFHSPLVADAREPFAAALAEVPFAEARIPVFSNTSAAVYPSAASASRDLLASHLAKPVDFIAEIRAMHAAGATTFLEVGPGRVLTRNGTLDLATVLCRLAALGHTVNLAKWEIAPPAAPTGKPAFTVPISGANVRTSKPAPRPAIAAKPAPVPAPVPAVALLPTPVTPTPLPPDLAASPPRALPSPPSPPQFRPQFRLWLRSPLP